MAQTIRPIAEIFTLLADNTMELISAQDVRDAIISLYVNATPVWTDVEHVADQLVRRPDGRVYVANDAIPAGTGFVEGTTGATWQVAIDGSGLVAGVAEGRILTVDATGRPVASAMHETANEVMFDKNAMFPGGTVSLEGFEISNPGGQLFLHDTAIDVTYGVPSRVFDEATGSGFFGIDDFTAVTAADFQPRDDETVTITDGSTLRVNITELASALIQQWETGVGGTGKFYVQIRRGTTASDPIIYVSHTPAQIAAENVFSMGGGNTVHDSRSHPLLMLGTVQYVVEFIAVGGDAVFPGTTVTQADVDNPESLFDVVGQEVPFFRTTFKIFSQLRVLTENDIRSDEQVQDLVAAMVVGGTHNGLAVTYDDENGVINLNVTGTAPPVSPDPGVSALSIGIPATVNVGTNLNASQTVRFTTQGTSSITALTLVVTGGDDITLTVPTMDGSHTQAVTLAGIDTSSAGSVTFQIRGTTSDSQTIMSNVQTVNVRAVQDNEQAYYGVQSLESAFPTVPLAQLTAVDVQQPGSSYEISTSFLANYTLGILEPTDRPITSILEQTFGVESLDRFTRTAAARTIGGQTYDLLTLTNDGPTGDIDFEVTHG